ncbi:hypothetical protein DFH06DRAFT_1430893, partial [Mycena polygramma]
MRPRYRVSEALENYAQGSRYIDSDAFHVHTSLHPRRGASRRNQRHPRSAGCRTTPRVSRRRLSGVPRRRRGISVADHVAGVSTGRSTTTEVSLSRVAVHHTRAAAGLLHLPAQTTTAPQHHHSPLPPPVSNPIHIHSLPARHPPDQHPPQAHRAAGRHRTPLHARTHGLHHTIVSSSAAAARAHRHLAPRPRASASRAHLESPVSTPALRSCSL